MAAMSVDMDEEIAPANTSSVIGSREACARINENDTLDADEDSVDGLNIDVTADDVPVYSNAGTPGNLTDDTGGIVGHQFTLNYASQALTIQQQIVDAQAVNILARNVGSTIFDVSDVPPDDNADNSWLSSALDTSTAPPESGDGVLGRLTLTTDAGATAGAYGLTLSESAHLDAQGAAYAPAVTNAAVIAVNEACGVSSPPPPQTPGPPTATPTPPTETPRPTAPPAVGPMDAMSIDMDEEAAPANTSSALGSREACARINENDMLDADEDAVDALNIDVTAAGVRPFNDNGTPSTRRTIRTVSPDISSRSSTPRLR